MVRVCCIKRTAGHAWTASVHVDGQYVGKAICLGIDQTIRVPDGVDQQEVARQVALWNHQRLCRRRCEYWTLYQVPGQQDVQIIYQRYSSRVRDELVGQYGAAVTILNEEPV